MTADDLAVIVRGITPIVREYTAAQVEPLLKTIASLEQRLAAAEQRPLVPGPAGKDAPVVEIDLDALAYKAAKLIPVPENGKDAEVDLHALAQKAADLIPRPENGKDAPPVDLQAVAEKVDLDTVAKKAAALIPVPTNGKDAEVDLEALAEAAAEKAKALIPIPVNGTDGKDAEPVDLDALALKAAELVPVPKDGRDGTDGKDATVDAAMLAGLVEQTVTKAMATIRTPEDGRSVTVEDVAPLIRDEVTKAVAAIPPAKDGVGVMAMMQDRQGHLIVTLTDGQTKDVGLIPAGRDVDMDAVTKMVTDTLDKWPKPTNGIDGKDGVGFDDLSFDHDDEGRLLIKYQRGDVIKTALVPCIVDRGVWREGTAYIKGDGVTWGGSWFIAQVNAPTTKPETSKEWRLATKRGENGKAGQKGLDGKPGRDGKDLTPQGARWPS